MVGEETFVRTATAVTTTMLVVISPVTAMAAL
jgi:hypothetical protein